MFEVKADDRRVTRVVWVFSTSGCTASDDWMISMSGEGCGRRRAYFDLR